MKCPHCGHEMPDGYLICDKCGEEIQIVPDFEPEIENSISETLSTLVSQQEDDIVEDMEEDTEEEDEMIGRAGIRNRKPQVIFAFVILLLVAFVSYALYAYHIHTVDYQINKAVAYAEKALTVRRLPAWRRHMRIIRRRQGFFFWKRTIIICSRWTTMRCRRL